MTLHDPDAVRVEYSTEAALAARRAAYEHATGLNAPQMVFRCSRGGRPAQLSRGRLRAGRARGARRRRARRGGRRGRRLPAHGRARAGSRPRRPCGRRPGASVRGRVVRLRRGFGGDNGEALLRPHFADVEVHNAGGAVTFPDREAVLAYVRASRAVFDGRDELPELDGPLTVTLSPMLFVATR